MNPDTWPRVKEIFEAALARPSAQRAAFLAGVCDGDDGLRREVESLLGSHEKAGSFLQAPAVEAVAESLIGLGRMPADGLRLVPGQTINHYEILSSIGKGGMGEVYLAHDTQLARKVALKLLPAQFTQDFHRIQRFQHEARAVSALNHPNIITIYEIGKHDSAYFIATEFIDGVTLREKILDGPLPLALALDIAAQVALALNVAHEAKIIHRDIKPENIMIRADGLVKVLDFGLAKLALEPADSSDSQAATLAKRTETEPGKVMGTVAYMSPEQARGLKVDARTDIWSVGVVLYEMVAGRQPFVGITKMDVLSAILNQDPETPTLNPPRPELETIISRALRKDWDERYRSVQDMLLDLKSLKRELEMVAASGLPREFHKNGKKRGSEARRRTTSKKERATNAITSLAVLPLAITSSDADAEYLADGIAESIINNLSQIPRLRVVPRATAFRYKGQEIDSHQIGKALHVKAMLTGRVIQKGESLNIQVELIDIANEAQVWGEQYQRNLSDIVAIPNEISEELADRLRLKLPRGQKNRLAKRYTENAEAYQLYLKGRYFWIKRTPANLQKAISFYQQAVDVDPKYALAYAGLADCYMMLGWVEFAVAPPREVMPKAKEAALKALELDDSLAEAHTSLAFILERYDWDWAGAENEFKKAIRLNPNYPTAHHLYGGHLIWTGRIDEGLKEAEKARDLNPLSPMEVTELGWYLYFSRKYDDAIEQFQQTIELDPSYRSAHLGLGLARIQKLMFKGSAGLQRVISRSVFATALAFVQRRIFREAISEFQIAITLSEPSALRITLQGLIHILSGERDEALKIVGEGRQQAEQGYFYSYYMVTLYLALGETDAALAWLEKMYEERSDSIALIGQDPMFDIVRSDRRFVTLMERVGLPQKISEPGSEKVIRGNGPRGSRRGISRQLTPSQRASDSPEVEDANSLQQSTSTPERSIPAENVRSTASSNATITSQHSSSAEYIVNQVKLHKLAVVITLSVMALIVALSIASYFYLPRSKVTTINSMAVLPFINAGSDSSNDYLSDGLTESLINSLSHLPEMRMIARSTVVRYKGKETDPQTVGRELGVQAIVTGRVMQHGDDLSVSAELVDVNTNTRLWGDQYNRKLTDLLKIQSEISDQLSTRLRSKSSADGQQGLPKRYTDNTEAYQLYLKGRYFLDRNDEASIQRAREYFQQAIEKDPSYALAYSGVADTYLDQPGESNAAAAKTAVLKALEIDNGLAEGHISLANILWHREWDFARAEPEFERGIELNPNNADAHHWHSHYLMAMGRSEESLTESKRYLELDPISATGHVHMGWYYLETHQYDQAIQWELKALTMDTNFRNARFQLAEAYYYKGMFDKAVEEYLKAGVLSGATPEMIESTRAAYQTSGIKGFLQKWLDTEDHADKRLIPYVPKPQMAAKLHARLGETEQAWESLERAVAEHNIFPDGIRGDAEFDNLRSDPRFTNLLTRIGLPQ